MRFERRISVAGYDPEKYLKQYRAAGGVCGKEKLLCLFELEHEAKTCYNAVNQQCQGVRPEHEAVDTGCRRQRRGALCQAAQL